MAKLNLTSLSVEHLKPQEKQYLVWDMTLKSFGIRISPAGTKTFVVIRGKERKITSLGKWPETTLKAARTAAMAHIVTKTPEKGRFAPKTALLAFEQTMKGRVKKDTLTQYLSYLNQMELTTLDLTYQDVQEKLEKWDGKPFAQNYAHASLRVFLNFCLEHGYIDKHPLIRKKAPNKVVSRSRVLSDDELARIWRCTEDDTYGRILRLLILTGQRRTEVRNLKPEDVKDGTITFHTKGDRINVLPLTPLVEENLKLPFKFNNWSQAKDRFDTECGVEDWTHHDCRRSLATKLAAMQTPVVVIERILGHSFGGKVFQTYQRHSFLEESRQALLTWEAHIRKIVALGH